MKFTTSFSYKNVFLLSFLMVVFSFGNAVLAQDCNSLFGPTGEPAQGLNVEFCTPTPGAVVLNATATGTTPATAYVWSTGATTPLLPLVLGGTYTVTISATGAPTACILNYTVTANANPFPDLSNSDTVFCAGDQGVLRAPLGYTNYLWSGSTSGDDSLVVTSPGQYHVTVTDTNGCFGRDSIMTIENPLPVVNLGTGSSICEGDSVLLDAGQGFDSYAWSTGDTLDTLYVMQANTYSVTVTDTNSCVGSDSYVLSYFMQPTVDIGADDTLCEGFSKTLDAGAGFNSYLWSDGTSNQTAVFDTTGNHWVEVVDVNGCNARDTMHLEVRALPSLNLGANDSICADQPYTLNAGNPGGTIDTYAWSTGSTFQTISIAADPNLAANTVVDYSVTITDVYGCVNMDTMTLSTFILPTPDLGNDTSFCVGSPFTMTLSPGTYAAYSWSNGSTSAAITVGAVAGIYTVTVTDGTGCQNDDALQVSQNQLPVPNLGPDDDYCQGNSFTKVLNAGLFDSYLWTDGSTGQVLGVSSAGTYGVTVTDANGCENNDEVVITENPTPIVDLGPDVSYCEDETPFLTLDATTYLPSNNFTFLWNTGETTGVINAVSFGSKSVLVRDQTTNCSATSSMDIIAIERAVPDLGEDGQVCQGQLILLDPQVSIPGYNYLWSTGANTSTINIFETGEYWVQMDAIDGTCMGNTDTVYFSPGVLPVVNLGADQYICDGQKVTLLDSSTPFPEATYEWQDSTTGYSYVATETGVYEVEVTNECGSTVDQVYLEFQDCGNVYIPTAFTPNGDGRNEIFAPKSDQEFSEFGFWVYDRWGSLLFKTNQPNVGWDGTVNGEYMQPGTYVWRVSYVSSYQEYGLREERSGEFHLLR